MKQQEPAQSNQTEKAVTDVTLYDFIHHTEEALPFIRQMQGGRLYPACLPVHSMERIMDLGCGSGAWIFELSRLHPHLHIYGIESDRQALQQARIRRNQSSVRQIELREMDPLQPLSVPDNFLDLIQMRFRGRGVPPATWPTLLRECWRMLRPGGWLLLVDADYYELSSPAFMRLYRAAMQALMQIQHTMDKSGLSFGFAQCLYGMLIEAGFEEANYETDSIDLGFMSGKPGWAFLMKIMKFSSYVRPLIVQQNLLSAQEFDALVKQAHIELQHADLCGWGMLISAYGRKSE